MRSYRSRYDSDEEEEEVVIVVESNGDGTYSPIRRSVRHTENPRSIFDDMTQEQLFKVQFDMEAEVNRLVAANPKLDLGMVEPGSLPHAELKGYLDHVKGQISLGERWKWLDMGMESVYSIISYAMEKCNVPMKEYFDRLKSKVVDYRQLLVADPEVASIVDRVLPVIGTSETKSPWMIVGVLILQIVVGCVAATIASMGSKGVAAGSNFGAMAAAEHLDGYIFGNKSLLDAVTQVGKSIFTKEPLVRPAAGTQVDV